jgi:hypothetical protein
MRLYGDPEGKVAPGRYHTRTEEERFWGFVNKTETCWLWTGAQAGRPGSHYGVFRRSAPYFKMIYAHRWSWENANGPVPEGLVLDHVRTRGCTSKLCVRLEHLEVVSGWENTLRGDSPPAVAQRLNQCRKGHSDWYTYPDGRRRCRVCQRDYERAWHARTKER